ncbi:Hypothetical predicted protein [Paramuricea clavata]|uniref:Uncharacterized protein n=1 Tax=Paramuricea clavata TaxID=317549 RepID=A0A7D9DMP8_PARCT|nr:Hypothetical predicted protein [Paramuricea clavata]
MEKLAAISSDLVNSPNIQDFDGVVVATDTEEVVTFGDIDHHNLAPCNHEEADTRILLHVKNAVDCGHRKAGKVNIPSLLNSVRLSLCNQDDPSEDLLNAVERYVVLLYDKTTSLSNVNEARRHLFTKKTCPSENLPPTKDALHQHIKRAIFQGG